MHVFTMRANRVRHQMSQFSIVSVDFNSLDVLVTAYENSVVLFPSGTLYGSNGHDFLQCKMQKVKGANNGVYGWELTELHVKEDTNYYSLVNPV